MAHPLARAVRHLEQGDWEKAHELAQDDESPLGCWAHGIVHVLEGDNPVVEWTKGTGLRPYLDALEEPDRGGFLAAYAARVASAYPKQADGRTLLPFRRIFFVAQA